MKDADLNSGILIVDDEEAGVGSLRRTLRRAGFTRLTCTTDPREAVRLCKAETPDLILLDLHMPYLPGDEVLTRMRGDLPADRYIPVIVLTGDCTREAKRRAFQAGAHDFLPKPFDSEEILFRVTSQLSTARLQSDLKLQTRRLEEAVRERTGELHRAQLELIDRLARASEFRDDDTGEHAQRVGALSARIASELGMPDSFVELLHRAATLHDVGKIGISDTILLKPGKLTSDEMATMREHVRIGAHILSGGSSRYLQVAETIALYHHEWWDGNGYLGLSGEAIPIEGRIVAVADVFDALTHERPYKAAWTRERAIAHIAGLGGTQFDPAVVEAFSRMISRDGALQEPGAVRPSAIAG